MPTTFPVSSAQLVDSAYLNAYGSRLIRAIEAPAGGSLVSFVTIPQTYKHLMVMWKARSNRAGNLFDGLGMRLHGGVSNVYCGQSMQGVGATPSDGEAYPVNGDVMSYVGLIPGATAGANNDACGFIFVQDYTDSTQMYARATAISGGSWNSSTGAIDTYQSDNQQYSTLAALTRIDFLCQFGTAFTYAYFRLYGMG